MNLYDVLKLFTEQQKNEGKTKENLERNMFLVYHEILDEVYKK